MDKLGADAEVGGRELVSANESEPAGTSPFAGGTEGDQITLAGSPEVAVVVVVVAVG